MRFLLISGLGPGIFNTHRMLDGTLLQRTIPEPLAATYARLAGQPVNLWQFKVKGADLPLIRRADTVAPHLPTATVRSILESSDIDYEWFDAEAMWRGASEPPSGDYDVVGLSTTFIWDRDSLAKAIRWITDRYPAATIVLGGQYSNLKYHSILNDNPDVDYIIRGDAEAGLPQLVRALAGKMPLAEVMNLVWRAPDGSVQDPPVAYIDLENHPSPRFRGTHAVVPYESMRGCPFTCKFCSFPFASPKWRYKSADKILRDWADYAETNGAEVVKAYDSTFTIPPTRFRDLLSRLPALGVPWEGYSRANTIGTPEIFQQLEEAHCRRLFVGFEAMNKTALKNMDKKVTLEQNKRTIEAMKGSSIEVRGSFMVGYPGESPDDYALTHQFLLNEYAGPFNIHFFMFGDETMPVWEDAGMYGLEVESAGEWKHCGMDSETAIRLRLDTLRAVRWGNDQAVHDGWQLPFIRPLVPQHSLSTSLRVEKRLEQLAFLVRDLGEGEDARHRCRTILAELDQFGVQTQPANSEG
ncbi:MAG: B12-binding domain-containing radical SAM protein [Acidimicrobiia bacterium]